MLYHNNANIFHSQSRFNYRLMRRSIFEEKKKNASSVTSVLTVCRSFNHMISDRSTPALPVCCSFLAVWSLTGVLQSASLLPSGAVPIQSLPSPSVADGTLLPLVFRRQYYGVQQQSNLNPFTVVWAHSFSYRLWGVLEGARSSLLL